LYTGADLIAKLPMHMRRHEVARQGALLEEGHETTLRCTMRMVSAGYVRGMGGAGSTLSLPVDEMARCHLSRGETSG